MIVIRSFKQMKLNTAYRVFNSAGESRVLEYTGSYFSGADDEQLVQFREPGSSLFEEWFEEDFLLAINDEDAQKDYERFCESVADEMFRTESLMFAIQHTEQVTEHPFVQTLTHAGKSFRDFKEDVQSKLVHGNITELF
ncbi:hypothetical protein [Paenibacillus sp. NPDC093718]|uniref:hypothetical protein n=1 Tax=Paenibacillus sp. NPDC093718 TaxID=3390601 RepID=UPI003D01C41F